jgi:HPt (histidine-containing phosphotransfer) domain-containing protein
MDGAAPIDLSLLKQDYGDAAVELLPALLDGYRKSLRSRLASFATGLQTGDQAAIARTAHAMKGSCAFLGARALGAACVTIEAKAKREQADWADLARFAELAGDVLAALRARVEGDDASRPAPRPA